MVSNSINGSGCTSQCTRLNDCLAVKSEELTRLIAAVMKNTGEVIHSSLSNQIRFERRGVKDCEGVGLFIWVAFYNSDNFFSSFPTFFPIFSVSFSFALSHQKCYAEGMWCM